MSSFVNFDLSITFIAILNALSNFSVARNTFPNEPDPNGVLAMSYLYNKFLTLALLSINFLSFYF
jgi:hypothetical protein